MKRFWSLVLIAGIAILAMSAFWHLSVPRKGDVAPYFALQNLEGRIISLGDLQGHPFILHFWATWCDYCRGEFPLLARLQRDFEGDGLVVLGVSVDGLKGEGDVKSFLKTVDVNFPILMDIDGSVSDEYGSYGVPESILIDSKGVIARRFEGIVDWNSKNVRELVKSLFENGGNGDGK